MLCTFYTSIANAGDAASLVWPRRSRRSSPPKFGGLGWPRRLLPVDAEKTRATYTRRVCIGGTHSISYPPSVAAFEAEIQSAVSFDDRTVISLLVSSLCRMRQERDQADRQGSNTFW